MPQAKPNRLRMTKRVKRKLTIELEIEEDLLDDLDYNVEGAITRWFRYGGVIVYYVKVEGETNERDDAQARQAG